MRLPPHLCADLIRALPLALPIEVVDIGASGLPTSEKPPYDPLLAHGLARLTGFEPNPEELAKLPVAAARRYLPHAVGDGGPVTLHLTRHPGFVSTLAPDPAVTAHIHSFAALTEVTGRHPVQTVRLDDLADLPHIDFLKIDIQGGELAAFRGGAQKLARALCIQTEVAFTPIYRDKPLFGDQDALLRSLGLRFFGFASAHRFPFTGTPDDLYFPAKRRDVGQLIDADAVYLTDFTRWDDLPDADLTRLFLILTLCYPTLGATLRLAGLLAGRGILSQALHRRLVQSAGTTA
ncbi:FkbM family methyltransferase [Rhodobacter calidifons]|uniref:FkbM family methyltransferase n=1 Tax=Rhodobacter calidifons TaxID=2715277 RepID=A0ABX0G4Y3_9RHOB|nr:FkbM family methyltransferase [Rhodobacter calidifons]NHB76042.1 FkbM family methyltransferase [Rhodobacter calidifons]